MDGRPVVDCVLQGLEFGEHAFSYVPSFAPCLVRLALSRRSFLPLKDKFCSHF